MAKIRKTVGDAAESVSESTSKLVKRAGKALKPVSRALGLSKKPARKTAKSKGGTTNKRSVKKNTK